MVRANASELESLKYDVDRPPRPPHATQDCPRDIKSGHRGSARCRNRKHSLEAARKESGWFLRHRSAHPRILRRARGRPAGTGWAGRGNRIAHGAAFDLAVERARIVARRDWLKALVSGATGFVGSHLVRALLHRGDSVRILARTAARAASLSAAGAEVCLGDLGEPKTLEGIAAGADVVFHLGSALRGSAD